MKYLYLFSFLALLSSCSDDVVSVPDFHKDDSYILKIDFSSVDTNYVYLINYIDSVIGHYRNIDSTSFLTKKGSELPFLFGDEDRDTLFVRDTIIQSYTFLDKNGVELFYLANPSDSMFVNFDGEIIDFTIPLKRHKIKGHYLVNKTSTPTSLIEKISYSYIYKNGTFADTINGQGTFTEDTLKIFSTDIFSKSIYTGSYDMIITGVDSDTVTVLSDTLYNLILNKDYILHNDIQNN